MDFLGISSCKDPRLAPWSVRTERYKNVLCHNPLALHVRFSFEGTVFGTPNKSRRNEAKREVAPTSSYDLDYDPCSEAEERPEDNSGFDVPTSRRSRQKAQAKARAQSVQSEADLDSDGDLQPVSRRTRPSVVDAVLQGDKATPLMMSCKLDNESRNQKFTVLKVKLSTLMNLHHQFQGKKGAIHWKIVFRSWKNWCRVFFLAFKNNCPTKQREQSRPLTAVLNIDEELAAAKNGKAAGVDDAAESRDVPVSPKYRKRTKQMDAENPNSQKEMYLSQQLMKKRKDADEETKRTRDFTQDE